MDHMDHSARVRVVTSRADPGAGQPVAAMTPPGAAPPHRARAWAHAAETAFAAALAVTAATVIAPRAGAPGWAVPLVSELTGLVIAGSARSQRRSALAGCCAAMGTFLATWGGLAGADPWRSPLLIAWLAGMAVLVPAVASVARRRDRDPEPAITPPTPEDEHDAEMRKFEAMLADHGCEVRVLTLSEGRAGRVLQLELPLSGKVTLGHLESIAVNIGVSLRLRHGAVEFAAGAHSGLVTMRLRERNVLAEVPVLTPELRARTVNRPFAVGIREDGPPHCITVRELNWLVVGTLGAGKSTFLNTVILQLASCPDAVLWGIDLKGGRTMRAWLQAWAEGKAPFPALDWIATTRAEANLMTIAFEAVCNARMNSGRGGSKIAPNRNMPQVVLFNEEASYLYSTDRGTRKELIMELGEEEGAKATSNTEFIARAKRTNPGTRSEAATYFWATQRGTASMGGSADLKALTRGRVALGVTTEGELQHVIPGVRAGRKTLVALGAPGVGMTAVGTDSSGLVKFFPTDHVAGQCSENGNDGCVPACPIYAASIEVGPVRPPLDEVTAAGVEEALAAAGHPGAYARRWDRAAAILGPMAAGRSESPGSADRAREVASRAPERVHPARIRARNILASRGVEGGTTKYLMDRIRDEGIPLVERETFQRWLAADDEAGIIHHARFNRWVTGPAPEKKD